MAEGKKRRRDEAITLGEPIVQNDSYSEISVSDLENYIEVIFYECAISAQYTANIQILFKIEDITQRMIPTEFTKKLSVWKHGGNKLVKKIIENWLKKQEKNIIAYFSTPGIETCTMVLLQRSNVTCTINGKPHRLNVESEKAKEIEIAINLLRYPFIVMEKIQRMRSESLLDIQKDAGNLIAISSNFFNEAEKMKSELQLLLS